MGAENVKALFMPAQLVKCGQAVYNSARFRHRPVNPAVAGIIQHRWNIQLRWKIHSQSEGNPKW